MTNMKLTQARFLSLLGACWTAASISDAADYREMTPLTPALAREALDPALMCGAIYQNSRVYGWEGPFLQIGGRDTFNEATGLAAGIYERPRGGAREIAICFRGTDDAEDWRANFRQALFGEVPEQYHEGLNLAQLAMIHAKKSAPPGQERLTITGHSLGGGLAAFSGIFLGQRTIGFASAPLGTGTQAVLGDGRLRSAPKQVTHFFMNDDIVPDSEAFAGSAFGRIAEPRLEPPPNWSGVMSEEDRWALLILSGLNRERSPYLSRGAVAVRLMAEGVNQLARHSMDNYIGALVSRLGANSADLSLTGIWESKGSFFQISSTTTRFTLTANGRLVMSNATDVAIPMIDIKERIIDIADTGTWEFDGRWLDFTIGGFALCRYELTATEANSVAQWRRATLEPDLAGLTRIYQAQGEPDPAASAEATALMLRGVFFLMKDKVVTWIRDPASPVP